MNPDPTNPNPAPQPEAPATPVVDQPAAPAPVVDQTPAAPAEPNTNQAPATPVATPAVAPMPAPAKGGKKKLGLIIGIAVGALVVAGGIVAAILLLGGSKDLRKELLDYALNSPIPVEDADGNYALFSPSGEKLTDFNFGTIYGFSQDSDTSLARDKDSNEVIIDKKGNIVAGADLYSDIDDEDYFYVATDKLGRDHILDRNGNSTYDIPDGYEVDSHYYFPFAFVYNEDKSTIVVSPKGKEVVTFNGALNMDEDEDFNLDVDSYHSILYMGGVNYIFNNYSKSKVGEIKSSIKYCIESEASLDTKTFVITDCDSDDDLAERIVMSDGKQLYKRNDCERMSFKNDVLTCRGEDYDQNYVLNEKGENIINIGKVDAAILTTSKYATEDNDTISFFKGGKQVATLKDSTIDSTMFDKNNDLYLIHGTDYESYKDIRYSIVKSDGTPLTDKKYTDVDTYGISNLAVVEEEEDTLAYIIDLNGKKVSNDYETVVARNDGTYFYATKGSKSFILNSKGKEVFSVDAEKEDFSFGLNYVRVNDGSEIKYYSLKSDKPFYTKNAE